MIKHAAVLVLILSILTAVSAEAKVVVDVLFTDNMVLQCDAVVPIWGKADPGEKVTVQYVPGKDSGHAPQTLTVQADESGKWMVRLQPLSASAKGAAITIKGEEAGETTVLKNVLVGEVWLGAGQSNMAYGTRHYTEFDPDLEKAVSGGPHPILRVYVDEAWRIADSNSVHDFSAILFSFGHALQKELDVPIGLMYGAKNGTPSGRWMTEEMAEADAAFMKMFKEQSGFASFDEMNADWKERRAQWKAEVKKAKADGKRPPRFLTNSDPMGDLYENHIAPFVPYAIRGVLWDQGESGTKVPGVDQYTVMGALIAGWRKAWGQGDFPFLHVQKPSGGGCAWNNEHPTDRKPPLKWEPLPSEGLPEDRKCEKNLEHVRMATLKNAPLVATSDLAPGTHPPTKYAYGKRACLVALGNVYGRDLVTCGPMYKSHSVKGDAVEVEFTNIGKGLAFRHGEKLQGFEIAGAEMKWAWAEARIEGDKVVASNGGITKPRHVRYAFNRIHNWANLFNKDGLPALMFTTERR